MSTFPTKMTPTPKHIEEAQILYNAISSAQLSSGNCEREVVLQKLATLLVAQEKLEALKKQTTAVREIPKEQLFHLLIPGEFRVWCRPTKPPGVEMSYTNLPSKTTCSNCLTKFRRSGGKRKSQFKVSHTGR